MKILLKIILHALLWALALLLAVNFAMYLKTKPRIYESAEDAPKAQAALIPGAALAPGGKLSPVFEERAEAALALYRAGKVQKILVSGDNSSLFYNEVTPVKKYLLAEGVPEEDIFLDHAGLDTYSSMYRAREIFEAKSIIVTTQSFHLPRAVFVANFLELEAYGLRAGEGRVAWKNYARETLASGKAFFDLLLAREPRFMGPTIPLE